MVCFLFRTWSWTSPGYCGVRSMGSSSSCPFIKILQILRMEEEPSVEWGMILLQMTTRLLELRVFEKVIAWKLWFTVKLCYWRRIEDFAGCHIPWYYYDTMDSGVFADGALYWRVKVENNGKDVDHILAFDLGTETHRLLPLPPGIFERDKPFLKRGEVSHRHLHVLSGYLFLSCSYGMYLLDGWKMEDCGEIKSWIKLFSCISQQVGTAFVDARPLAYLESKGKVLFQLNSNKFFWYQVEHKSERKLRVYISDESRFSSQVCQPSLFHLHKYHGAGGSGGTKRSAGVKKKPANKRLKLIVNHGF